MPTSPSTLLILFLVAVGFLVGAGLATWLANRQKPGKPGDQVQPATSRVSSLNEAYFEEVVSLWRRKADGQLIVAQHGNQVETADQMPEVKRKQWELATREWLVWLGLLPAKTAGIQPQSTDKSVVPPAEPGSALQPETVRGKPTVAEMNKGMSIVKQVNEILQENLRVAGQTQRGISLADDPVTGVVVYIGLQRFTGIDAVTDPEVKILIKDAVKEWERRTEKG